MPGFIAFYQFIQIPYGVRLRQSRQMNRLAIAFIPHMSYDGSAAGTQQQMPDPCGNQRFGIRFGKTAAVRTGVQRADRNRSFYFQVDFSECQGNLHLLLIFQMRQAFCGQTLNAAQMVIEDRQPQTAGRELIGFPHQFILPLYRHAVIEIFQHRSQLQKRFQRIRSNVFLILQDYGIVIYPFFSGSHVQEKTAGVQEKVFQCLRRNPL